MLQHLAGLAEQRDRSRDLLGIARLTERTGRRHAGRKSEKRHQARQSGGPGGHKAAQRGGHHLASLTQFHIVIT